MKLLCLSHFQLYLSIWVLSWSCALWCSFKFCLVLANLFLLCLFRLNEFIVLVKPCINQLRQWELVLALVIEVEALEINSNFNFVLTSTPEFWIYLNSWIIFPVEFLWFLSFIQTWLMLLKVVKSVAYYYKQWNAISITLFLIINSISLFQFLI